MRALRRLRPIIYFAAPNGTAAARNCRALLVRFASKFDRTAIGGPQPPPAEACNSRPKGPLRACAPQAAARIENRLNRATSILFNFES